MGIHIDHELMPLSAEVPYTAHSRSDHGDPQPCMMPYAERHDVGATVARGIPDSNLTPTPPGALRWATVLRNA